MPSILTCSLRLIVKPFELHSSWTRFAQPLAITFIISIIEFVNFSGFAYSNDLIKVQSITQEFILGLKSMEDPITGLVPSHKGHPGYERLSFVYDQAINALIFKAGNNQEEAEKVLDYFVKRTRLPVEEVKNGADSNSIYGILKLLKSDKGSDMMVAPVNALDVSAQAREGRSQLEFWTTPGPIAFMVMALLQVNSEKYKEDALRLGKVLLAMQRQDGGIIDGDRGPGKVHTEPHMDTYSAFLQLYQVTQDPQWQCAAENAFNWFKRNVFKPEEGKIYQGLWETGLNSTFATDSYSWTMAGPAGDKFPYKSLHWLTHVMLNRCLSRVDLELPDGKKQSLILVDFTDSEDPKVQEERHGFHPMGSMEWAGGVILALQKNAVRFWNAPDAKDRVWASFYKGLAELLLAESQKGFYRLPGTNGKFTFYATGQGVAVGHGWDTPYFYVKPKFRSKKTQILGASTVGGWPILPMEGLNPFVLKDNYKNKYDEIPLTETDNEKVKQYVNRIVLEHSYKENVPQKASDSREAIVEPGNFNQQMWVALNKKKYKEAVKWANKVVNNPTWIKIARRDQALKQQEVGGLVEYQWGTSGFEAAQQSQLISRYPILNEVGSAMWGLVQANLELGKRQEAKYWMKRLIKEVSSHQIYDPVKKGYWNAVISWNYTSGPLGQLFEEVIKETKQQDWCQHLLDISVDNIQVYPLPTLLPTANTPLVPAYPTEMGYY